MAHRTATVFRSRLAITLIAMGSLAIVLFIVSQWFTIEAIASHASISFWSARISLEWNDPPSLNTDATLSLGPIWFDIARNPPTYPYDAAITDFSRRDLVLNGSFQRISTITFPLCTCPFFQMRRV